MLKIKEHLFLLQRENKRGELEQEGLFETFEDIIEYLKLSPVLMENIYDYKKLENAINKVLGNNLIVIDSIYHYERRDDI